MSQHPAGGRRWLSVAAGLGLLAVGAVSALAALLLHGHWWGLVLAWVAGTAAVWALPRQWWGRPAFALGWVVVLVGALFPRAEGDFLVASNWQGYAILASGLALVPFVVLGISDLSRSMRRREASGLGRPS